MSTEAWCAWVKRETGIIVDWHYAAGYTIFKSLADQKDLERVTAFVPMLAAIVKGDGECLKARVGKS